MKINSKAPMNKKLSSLSVLRRIRILASSMIPRRKKGCGECRLWRVFDSPDISPAR